MSRSRSPLLLSWNLKTVPMSSMSVRAAERWRRFASERHDGQPTSATALLETIVQARPIFAATVRHEWVCPSLPDVVHLFGRAKAWTSMGRRPSTSRPFAPFSVGGLLSYFFRCISRGARTVARWKPGILSKERGLRTIFATLTERLPCPVCQASCSIVGDVRL